MYWDPMPTGTASAVLQVANHPEGRRLLGPPEEYLRGRWDERDWRNVPGPFYGAQTDSCWVGREVAPRHVLYEDGFGSEIVYRQPRTADEVRLVLTAAWNDPFGAYAADGSNSLKPPQDRWRAVKASHLVVLGRAGPPSRAAKSSNDPPEPRRRSNYLAHKVLKIPLGPHR